MKKRLVNSVICVSMLASSFIPSISVFAASNPTKMPDVQGVLDFSYEESVTEENVLYALAKANPAIDLNEAVVTEEVDSYGNAMFVIETAFREVEYFNEVTLAEIFVSLYDDPNAEVQLTGNTLSYTLPDGTLGEMVETIDQYGRRIVQVSEGNEFNEIIFDKVNNQVKLDGKVVTFYESQTFFIQQEESISPQSQQWTFIATTNHNMRAQAAIRSLTTGVVINLVASFLRQGPSLTIAMTSLIIAFFADTRPNHNTIYATRRMYLRGSSWRFRDSFYTWNARTNATRATSRTVYEHHHH